MGRQQDRLVGVRAGSFDPGHDVAHRAGPYRAWGVRGHGDGLLVDLGLQSCGGQLLYQVRLNRGLLGGSHWVRDGGDDREVGARAVQGETGDAVPDRRGR